MSSLAENNTAKKDMLCTRKRKSKSLYWTQIVNRAWLDPYRDVTGRVPSLLILLTLHYLSDSGKNLALVEADSVLYSRPREKMPH